MYSSQCPLTHLSIYLSIYLSIHPSTHLSIHLFIHPSIHLSKYLSVYGSTVLLFDLGRSINFVILYPVGRTPWTGDQPVTRPLPTHRTTQTEKTHTNIHALSRIRTHDLSVRASEDSSCFIGRGHCDRQCPPPYPMQSILQNCSLCNPLRKIITIRYHV
jgi:hypothetical protein